MSARWPSNGDLAPRLNAPEGFPRFALLLFHGAVLLDPSLGDVGGQLSKSWNGLFTHAGEHTT
jgi:hypothetical protein